MGYKIDMSEGAVNITEIIIGKGLQAVAGLDAAKTKGVPVYMAGIKGPVAHVFNIEAFASNPANPVHEEADWVAISRFKDSLAYRRSKRLDQPFLVVVIPTGKRQPPARFSKGVDGKKQFSLVTPPSGDPKWAEKQGTPIAVVVPYILPLLPKP